MRIISAFTIATTLITPACSDDGDIVFITTFQTHSGVTNGITVSGGDDGVSTDMTDTAGQTDAVPTTGDLSTEGTLGMSETSATTGPSIDTEPTTGDPPVQDPPSGCAHFVEVNGSQSNLSNYLMIDSSGCQRGQEMEVTITIFGGGPTASVGLGVVNGCHIWGGSKSPAAVEDGTVIAFPIPDEQPVSYALSLEVDGVVTDDVRVPAILKGQAWDNAPDAPNTPIRRASDFSWRVLPDHITGCNLNETP